MRPVSLTVSGLHSYRDPVTVDFEHLGRFGLFGIFGKIGSGKSTLLDAMTLALYGLVDRVATRSRKGLVNLAADRCEVRLRFAVDGPGGPELYEVQRSYRDHEGVAQRTASRLVQLGPGAQRVVLADKEREVNDAVVEVVGLGAEDFMRAVVLPQGRFMQLLHLKGTERRQMLQRIFRLHAYGEGLRRQVRDRQVAGRASLAEARGELSGLGDASAAAVKRARRAASEARGARNEAESAHTLASLRHEEAARRRASHERLARARTELAAHREQAPEIEAVEARVDAAERVRPVLAPARQWREAVTRHAEAATSAAAAAREEEVARAALTEAQAAVAAARARVREQEPDLRQRIGQLEQAVERARQRAALEDRLATLKGELEAQQQALGVLVHEREEAALLALELEGRRKRKRREHRKRQVAADERQRAQRAARAADALTRIQRLVTEARDDAGAASGRRAEAEAATETARAAEAHARTAHARAVQALSGLRQGAGWLEPDELKALDARLAAARRVGVLRTERQGEVQALSAAAEVARSSVRAATIALERAAAEAEVARQVRKGADAALRDAEHRLEASRRRRAAADLARELDEGVGCPVCGSAHHPSPAAADEDEGGFEAAVEAHREGRRRALERHEAALAAHAGAAAAAEAATAQLTRAQERLDRATTALAEVGSEDDVAALEQQLAAHRDLVARVAEAERAEQERAVAVERASAPVAAAEARLHDAVAAEQQALALLEQRRREEGEGWAAFDAERGELTLFDVGNAVAALEARDRAAEALFRELEQIDVDLAEAQAERDALQARETALERTVTQTEERLASLHEQHRELGTTGDDPAGALTEARDALGALEAAREQAEAAREAAGETHHRLARDRASAEAAARAASEALTEARERLEAALAPLGGQADDLEALEAQALEDSEVASLRARVSRWREAEAALAARVEMLDEGTGEPPPTEEAWQALQETLDQAVAALDTARDRAVEAARTATELEARAPRWAELTARCAALDAELTRLDTLSTVLRGDRFVEYVANDHLTELAARASEHLAALTHDRYLLELDEDAAFQIRDADAGGAVRPVHTLSGGEAFLTALSLALALSTQVQARSSRPLGFFFLDEGFGTLDPEALDRVMSAIEGLRDASRVIGLISHVPAIRERVPRYLWIHPAGRGGAGSSAEVRDN